MLLKVEAVEVVYERMRLALHGVSLELEQGQLVALLGSNGAGKTSTLRAISGLLSAELGEISAGRVHYAGEDITHADPSDLVRAGLVQVLEGRHCFSHLSVDENLRMGAIGPLKWSERRALQQDLDRVYALFPRLVSLRKRKAGYTSGGEQQMIAIGRALMAKPRLLLLDEPSMGLAPQVVEEIFEVLRDLHKQDNVSILIAEQNAALALEYADYAYIIENGSIRSHDTAATLATRSDIQALYLGGTTIVV